MRAAVFSGPNTMPVKEIPISNYRGKEALLKVKACAVCGYDARVFRNGHRKVRPPVILGHEICAETLETLSTTSGTVIKSRSRFAVITIVQSLNCNYEQSNTAIVEITQLFNLILLRFPLWLLKSQKFSQKSPYPKFTEA